MSEKLKLDIVTPYGSVFSEDVDEITAVGSEGEFGVLPGHAPFLTTLKSGSFSCKAEAGNMYFFVNWGYAEVGPEKVIILADSAELSTDIDVERAHEARGRAEERLEKEEKIDFVRAEAALERAITRIRIAEEHAA